MQSILKNKQGKPTHELCPEYNFAVATDSQGNRTKYIRRVEAGDQKKKCGYCRDSYMEPGQMRQHFTRIHTVERAHEKYRNHLFCKIAECPRKDRPYA